MARESTILSSPFKNPWSSRKTNGTEARVWPGWNGFLFNIRPQNAKLEKEYEVQLRRTEPALFDDWWDPAKAKTKKHVLAAKDRLLANVLGTARAKAVRFAEQDLADRSEDTARLLRDLEKLRVELPRHHNVEDQLETMWKDLEPSAGDSSETKAFNKAVQLRANALNVDEALSRSVTSDV